MFYPKRTIGVRNTGSADERLFERREAEREAEVAKSLGISLDEIGELEWRIEQEETDGGTPYSTLYIDEEADPAIIAKIDANIGGLIHSGGSYWKRVG